MPNRLARELSLVVKDLAGMGHHVNPVSGRAVGGFHSILVEPAAADATGTQAAHGFYRAGCDHRKDGQAPGW